MGKKRLRVLIAKFGDGHEAAMLKLAHACCEAGFEVVYTDMQDPRAIVVAAVQEAVDHIGITTLPGAKVEDFTMLFDLLAKEGVSHVRVTAGGFLNDGDIEKIKQIGVLDFYPRGSIYQKIEHWTREFGEVTDQPACAEYKPK
jgi:methylmalonyl-CoA mutase C-terminal domain/subunit